jgi:PTH1 family peptidyl-tRNA hydrolase
MSIGLIVGLGNPGPRYQNTRHNIGFRVVEAIAHRHQAMPWRKSDRFNALTTEMLYSGNKVELMKPLTFMNKSGQSIGLWQRYYNQEADSILVVYDDFSLDLGRSKLSVGGTGGSHNGVADIIADLGTNTFLRLRIGIGAKPHKEMPLADYVLSRFSADEVQLLDKQMDIFCQQIESILLDGATAAMNHINQKNISSNE